MSTEITCPLPNSPKNGIIELEKIAGKKRNSRIRKVGSLLKFSCLPGHKMTGEGSIICTENGTWSHEPPICKLLIHKVFVIIIIKYINISMLC